HGDFNDDLTAHGLDDLRAAIRPQIAPEDVDRFLGRGSSTTG
ncbi:MAG: DNA primase, partial [Thioclava marina]|nr:DNA primase [Thioclava marina]MBD3805113.1 DNA primase [Thioclava sp.]